MELNINILNDEFLVWTGNFGNGRNKQDLRFGQYLHFKYEVPMGIKGENEDGFYDEIPRNSYTKIINNLKQ